MDVGKLTAKQLKAYKKKFAVMMERSKDDPIYFIENFCYTFNPKVEPFHFKFKLFPFQRRLVKTFVKHINDGEDIFVEKCREMGVTYVGMAVLLWFWRFQPASNFLIGSRKEDYVDNRRGGLTGNKEESLFGKIDYMIQRMPEFALPKGYNPDKHFNYMSLVNPENGNVISGESSNPNFSRGGRQKAIFLDEFAFWDNDTAAWGATADTTNCRILVTTPGIKPGKAKKLRYGKDGEKIKVITLRYNLDPRKTRKWLEIQKKRRSKEDFNREIMIDWEGSTVGIVYPEVQNVKLGKFPLIPWNQLYCSWDFGLDGTAINFWQYNKKNNKWRLIESYEKSGEPIQFFFPFFGKPIDSKYQYSEDDLKALKVIADLPKAIHFGDPDVKKRSYAGGSTSTRLELSSIGIYVQCKDTNDFITRREKMKVALQGGVEANKTLRVEESVECIKNARYPARDDNSSATTPISKPIHDWTCLVGDTKIRTLQGWFMIKELVGKEFYVWSYSHKEKRLVPTKTSKCWRSGENATLIEVGLDNGKYIRCTPEHRFLLRNGTYIEVKNLKENYSLMPFYEFLDRGYNRMQLNDGSYTHEHRYVYSRFNGYIEGGFHIDHIDGDKFNNNPENLQKLSQSKHCAKTQVWKSNVKSRYAKRVRTITAKSFLKICPFCLTEIMMSYKQIYCNKKCTDASYKARKLANNHKVRYVKRIKIKESVYDIEVPKYHNFVAEGVVVHNSHHRTSWEYHFVNVDDFLTEVEEPDWVKENRDSGNLKKKYE